jgi:TonB family protein
MTMLLDIAVRGTIVLLLGLVACASLRRGAPALRHAVLAATLVAAPLVGPVGALLPAFEVALPRIDAPEPARTALASIAVTSDRVDTATTPASPASITPAVSTTARSWPSILAGVWALGTLLALAHLLLSLFRLARVTRTARPVSDRRWHSTLAAATRAAGLEGDVRLRESPRRDLLATWGWRRPYLLIPRSANDWPTTRIAMVLDHELAHVQRGDWAWQIIASLVRALFWWNPLAWLACHRLSLESERACDDAVLARGIAPQVYAEQLVAVARALHAPQLLPAVAVPMARPSTLQRRITAMLQPDRHRTVPGRLSTALLVGSLLTLLVPVAVIRGTAAQAPLEGVVYDPTGAVVPEVRLVLTGAGKKLDATTDAEGRFAFPGVEPGAYVLEGQLPGFRGLKQDVELRQPGDWSRVITLPLGDLRETINVTAKRGTGATAAAAGPVPVRVGGNIRPPRKLKDVKPIYPESMREAGGEGVVSIDAVIGRDGSVTAARVSSPQVHPDLAIAAIEAVRQWKFAPTLLNGTPVEVVMAVSVTFTLE